MKNLFGMVAFSLFGFSVYWYGIFYLIGFFSVYFFLGWIGNQKFVQPYSQLANLLKKDREDILLYSLFGVLFGGRLGYVLIYDFSYYLAHPLKVFAVHEGGMAFIGGIIGVVFAILILKKVKKLSWEEFFLLFDSVLVILPLAIGLGRFGNYLNQEVFGVIVNPALYQTSFAQFLENIHIIHVYPKVGIEPRFNTNFIAILFEGLVLFVILCGLFVKKTFSGKTIPGLISGCFLIFYSFFRFFIEYLRQDSQSEFVYGLTKSQWFFVIFIVLGLTFLYTRTYWFKSKS